MPIDLRGIFVIVGNYGSGKTEVAVNLAIHQRQAGKHVRIADLDLVNPYFRTREAKDALAEKGIDVVLPPKQYLQADLPVLTPLVSGMIRRPSELTIIDAGGDDVGATVLAALADSFKGRDVNVIQVVNPFRPFTETAAGCLKIKAEIEGASGLRVTALAGNAHLLEETTVDHIVQGYGFLRTLARKSGLPILFVTAMRPIAAELPEDAFDCPVLIMDRLLVLPWMR